MFLVDTNVMLAASAVDELSNAALRAMPQEVELREIVFQWLVEFHQSAERIVLDEEGLVRAEYERNMPYTMHGQEYGMQVLQNKLDRDLVCFVSIETFEGNGEHIAVLAPEHAALVPDREDRKWVACALAAQKSHKQMPEIVYGAETDWFIAERALIAIGLRFRRLLPEAWYNERVAQI